MINTEGYDECVETGGVLKLRRKAASKSVSCIGASADASASPLTPTAANLKRAEQHRAAILHAIASGTSDYRATFPESKTAARFEEAAATPGDSMTVGEYLDKWLDRQKLERKASTYETSRKMVIGKLDPWFGKLTLNEFRRKHMRDKLASYPAGNKTLGNIQSVMRSALDAAVEDDLIEVNPLAGYTYRKKREVVVAEDERSTLSTATSRPPSWPHWRGRAVTSCSSRSGLGCGRRNSWPWTGATSTSSATWFGYPGRKPSIRKNRRRRRPTQGGARSSCCSRRWTP